MTDNHLSLGASSSNRREVGTPSKELESAEGKQPPPAVHRGLIFRPDLPCRCPESQERHAERVLRPPPTVRGLGGIDGRLAHRWSLAGRPCLCPLRVRVRVRPGFAFASRGSDVDFSPFFRGKKGLVAAKTLAREQNWPGRRTRTWTHATSQRR